jgi:hypothetical protein
MVRVLGSAPDGRDAPLLTQYPAPLEPALDWLVGRIERLPEPAVQAIHRRAGWADAITAGQHGQVRSEMLADWVIRHYPRRRYPVVFIGSSNGAVVQLAAALGAPRLPQTLLLAVRNGGLDPDDPAADMRAMAPAGRALVEGNPGLALHHMHDPVQDRLMIAGMTYFRVKFLRLPEPYRAFLASCLAPGGIIVLVDCTVKWPTTTVGTGTRSSSEPWAEPLSASSARAARGSRDSCASRVQAVTGGRRPRPTRTAPRPNGVSLNRWPQMSPPPPRSWG